MAPEKRTRVACKPCRDVKRKCDGNHPCDTCQRYGLQCAYISKTETTPASPPTKKVKSSYTLAPAAPNDGTVMRSIAANSGLRFLRQLVKDIDPVSAPKVQLTAWNVGSRLSPDTALAVPQLSLTDLITLDQMVALGNVYFDKIDPCYSFVDQGQVFQQIQARWTTSHMPRSVDAMLCSIAACASYFSKINAVPVEPQLVAIAKHILDEANDLSAHDTSLLIAWVCRAMYLRWTSEPQAAWIASCSAMHCLEMASLRQSHRGDDGASGGRTPMTGYSPEIHRRLYGVAQHLNTWISYDLGLSRVSLQPTSVPPDSFPRGQYTDKLLELLPASLGLDPAEKQDDEALRSGIEHLAAKRDTQPPLIMAQTNLMLCILRRLSSFNNLRHSGDRTLDASLRFLTKALAAARQMVQDDTPWHHLANVPFQTFCILLAIDTPASLRMASDAMHTLQLVASAYDTPTLRDATNTAYLMLSLCRKRRLEDVAALDNILGALTDSGSNPASAADQLDEWPVPNETEVAWLHDLMSEIPSLQQVDLLDMINPDQINADPNGSIFPASV